MDRRWSLVASLLLSPLVGGCSTRQECKEFCGLVEHCGFGDGPLGSDRGGEGGCLSKCLASSDHLREATSQCVDAAAPDIDVKRLDYDLGWCGQSLLICESSRECIQQELGPDFTGKGQIQVVARAADAIATSGAACEVGYCWNIDKDRIDQECLQQGQLSAGDASAVCGHLAVEYVRIRIDAAGTASALEKDIDCVSFLRFGATLSDLNVGWVEVGAVLHGARRDDLCGVGVAGSYCVDLGSTEVVASAKEVAAAIRLPGEEALTQAVCAPENACDEALGAVDPGAVPGLLPRTESSDP